MNDRYSRQSILGEIGPGGQQRIAAGRVLCIGAGGLGCAALPYLAGAGVGRITIIDHDRVDRSNLQRQVLFGESTIGQPKAEAAARRLADLNPDLDIRPVASRLDADNVAELLVDHDIVVDGSDNFSTKYLAADACVRFGKALVYGTVTGMEAMVSVFDAGRGPCLRCLFPEPPTGWVPNCAEAGVLGPLVGMAGALQAAEALKLLVGSDNGLEPLIGRLWSMDARSTTARLLAIRRRPDCRTCSGDPENIKLATDNQPTVEEIDIEQAHALVDAPLIDVREADEFAAGHIPGAVNLPLSKLQSGESPVTRARRCTIYCETGMRCRTAAEWLHKQGVGEIYSLRGGMAAWRACTDESPTGNGGTF